MNDLSLLSITLVLFLIMDPIGSIGSYLFLMRDVDPAKRHKILLREMGIAFIAMVIFNFIGEFIFDLLEISEITVRLASGTILFLIAIQILFPNTRSIRANLPKGEPFIIPLAIPLVAGPSLLATVMLYAHMEPSQPIMLGAIFIATLSSLVVFWAAPFLQRVLGNNGLLALEKLMGMILVLLAVQRFADGLQQFYAVHGQ
jgi:multiple antibiotic resistance protein